MQKGVIKASTFLTSLVLMGVVSSTAATIKVSADTNNSSSVTQSSNSQNNKLDESTINYVNQFISVVDNQYVLNLPSDSSLTPDQVAAIKDLVQKSNDNVKQKNLLIDTTTKVANSKVPKITLRAAYNKHYTYANFWWGTRYYFTSNAAVEEFSYQFQNYGILLGVAGVAGGALGAIIGGVSAGYFTKIALDLEHYNALHNKNQIYLDLGYNLVYSCHILK